MDDPLSATTGRLISMSLVSGWPSKAADRSSAPFFYFRPESTDSGVFTPPRLSAAARQAHQAGEHRLPASSRHRDSAQQPGRHTRPESTDSRRLHATATQRSSPAGTPGRRAPTPGVFTPPRLSAAARQAHQAGEHRLPASSRHRDSAQQPGRHTRPESTDSRRLHATATQRSSPAGTPGRRAPTPGEAAQPAPRYGQRIWGHADAVGHTLGIRLAVMGPSVERITARYAVSSVDGFSR